MEKLIQKYMGGPDDPQMQRNSAHGTKEAEPTLKLVLFSPFFFPRIGGLETIVQVLATEWARMGHAVTVITGTSNSTPDFFPFRVLRRPGIIATISAYRNADAVILANISLWGLVPLLFCGFRRPPWIATHHIWYENPGHPVRFLDRVKKALARFADSNISVSHAVDKFLNLQGNVIPNPYDHQLFRRLPEVQRDRDLVFLGRLVSDKGCDLLLDALALLRDQGQTLSLTIIGSGPEQHVLEDQVRRLRLESYVSFTGSRSGEELVRLLNQHRIMVVPSRWNEPFGIVALEGIACGCVIVGSDGGGLPEAIGPCGVTFPNGDVIALQGALTAMKNESGESFSCDAIAKHLERHHSMRIASLYNQVIDSVVSNTRQKYTLID